MIVKNDSICCYNLLFYEIAKLTWNPRINFYGKVIDEETRLYYYGARYLAAWIGRFISSDPIGDDFPGLSNYQYASNNPILNIDLDGLEGLTGFFFGDQATAQRQAYEAQQKWGNPDSNLSNKKIENTPETNCSDSSCTEESLPSEEGSKDSSKPDYSSMAKTLDVEENVLKAIVSVESSGKGFTKNGKVVLRFEGHKFKKYLKENGFDVSKLERENPDLIYDYSEIKSKKHGRTQY